MGSGTTIELNGKRYDAKSGALLGVAPHLATAGTTADKAIASHHGRAIDGVVAHKRNSGPSGQSNVQQTKNRKDKHPAPHPGQHNRQMRQKSSAPAVRRAGTSLAPHQPEKSKTLMRRVVRKPKINIKPAIKTTAPAEVAAAPLQAVQPKLSAAKVNPSRMSHAQLIARSASIRHFGKDLRQDSTDNAVHVAHIPVRQAPVPGRRQPARVAPRPAADMFEAAIARATAHQERPPAVKSRRGYLLGMACSLVVFTVAVGALIYYNRASIEVRLASSKAGFHAALPSSPMGYRLLAGPSAAKNTVSLRYGSGDSSFTLVQQPSNLNSQSLLRANPAVSDTNYQTVVAGTALIYRYGATDAVWVNHGMLYTLIGNAELTNDQIITLAASL